MTKVELSGDFEEMYEELTSTEENLKPLILKTIELFKKNSKDTRLHDHALKKRMKGKYAFSVTDDIRIIYERIGKQSVRFLAIGTHEDVYQ